MTEKGKKWYKDAILIVAVTVAVFWFIEMGIWIIQLWRQA